MLADHQQSKFLRKFESWRALILVLALLRWPLVCGEGQECKESGKVRLMSNSGVITDGSGNYSIDTQCTWVIDSGQVNTSIRLHLDHFATECSWDHLYIFDGDSIYNPLLAVYSGMVVQDNYHVSHIPEVVARSGSALLHFSSDAAYSLTGFSISYRIDGCPRTIEGEECSGRGVCLDGLCTCNAGWSGPACSVRVCPEGCSGNGECNPEERRCQCYPGYVGVDCSQVVEDGWWEVASHDITSQLTHSNPSSTLLERSSHTSVLIDDALWVIGGYSFTNQSFILKYDIQGDNWITVESTSVKNPMHRYGHTAVVYNSSIYMYGGMKADGNITSELWRLDTRTLNWTLIPSERTARTGQGSEGDGQSGNGRRDGQGHEERNRLINGNGKSDEGSVDGREWKEGVREQDKEPEGEGKEAQRAHSSCSHAPCAPIRCVGHAAVVVQKDNKEVMLVIFGHSSVYGYLNTVQEYDLDEGTWSTVETRGAEVNGGYGHTAVWDPVTALVYVHGGLLFHDSTTQVTASLMTYEPINQEWKLQTPAPVPRFLHSAVLVEGLMLVFGGNTHNDTNYSHGAKCYSADFLAYDITCNSWHTLRRPPNLYVDVARYGHSASLHDTEMYVVGGFNGKMLGSILRYTPGGCHHLTSSEACLRSFPGRKCVWNRVLARCESKKNNDLGAYNVCSDVTPSLNFTELCSEQQSCLSCVSNTYGCAWCGSACTHNKCVEYKGVGSGDGCEEDSLRSHCKSLKTDQLCRAHQYCDWQEQMCVVARNRTTTSDHILEVSCLVLTGDNIPSTPPTDQQDHLSAIQELYDALHPHKPREATCAERVTCSECTESTCMWCFNRQRCVDTNSYVASFPYGQCLEWTLEAKKCMDLKQGDRRCSLHKTCKTCQADLACGWCDDGSGTGIGRCLEGGQRGPVNPITGVLNHTTENCSASNWFFTECPLCNCNGHSTCDNRNQCIQPCGNNTEGSHCQYCNERFYGSPFNGGLCRPCKCNDHSDICNKETGECSCRTKGVTGDHCDHCDTVNNYVSLLGSCFYDLHIDYQFTFNLSKSKDQHIRQINFVNVPTKSDVDIGFNIYCSKAANIKISSKTARSPEEWIVSNYTGTRIKQTFSASEYTFGSAENSTAFHVYVYNFTTPIEIVVSFFQRPKLNLHNFFSSLFSL